MPRMSIQTKTMMRRSTIKCEDPECLLHFEIITYGPQRIEPDSCVLCGSQDIEIEATRTYRGLARSQP